MNTADADSLGRNDKVIRLVEYLTALARIDRKIIRDVGSRPRTSASCGCMKFLMIRDTALLRLGGRKMKVGKGLGLPSKNFVNPSLPPLAR